jgi:DNA-binding transcriptional MerR regulator
MTHLSVKALRHYHDVGVLIPVEIDPVSGYRFYDAAQVPRAHVIHRLRDLDMPLDDVRSVLEASDVTGRDAAIAAHLERMESQLAEVQGAVSVLRSLLEPPAETPAVTQRVIAAAETVAITERVHVADFGPWWSAVYPELYDALRQAGVTAVGPSGALYSDELFEREEGEVTAFVPVAERTAVPGRAVSLHVPEVEAAVAVHRGSMAELDVAYGASGLAAVRMGAISVPGPIREYYLVGPLDTPDESRHRTEVCWPVFRTNASLAAPQEAHDSAGLGT